MKSTVIIKVGTSTLTYPNGALNESKIKSLVAQVAYLHSVGHRVVMVSSGAVGAGMGVMGLSNRPGDLSAKQALAAIGQVALMHLYERLFWAYDLKIAQLLLTREDFANRSRFLSARSVCAALLESGVVPIINENDPVVADELKVGDNDTLSALVAALVDASLVIILSDIDGLYDKNPNEFEDAKLIPVVKTINDEIRAMAGGSGSKFGTGGMLTKINAALMSTSYGTELVIANGSRDNVLKDILDGKNVGTRFLAQQKRLNLKKYWLAYGVSSLGKIIIDKGALSALKQGKSLLGVGVLDVKGRFERGDVVDIFCETELVASGMSSYGSGEILQIRGLPSNQIQNILGYKFDDYIIHANNLSLVEKGTK